MNKITPVVFRKSIYIFLATLCFYIEPTSAQADWVHVPSPNPSVTRNMLRGISGTSTSDIWTVGSYQETLDFPPYYKQNDLIMHWNGSDWFTYPPMNLSTNLDDLFDVEAIAPDNVWAVGIFNGASDSRAEILHFNGTQWQAQNPPAILGGSGLFSIDATAANDIWASGSKTASPTRPAYVLHYNGSSWSDVPVPPVGLYRNELRWIDAISPTDVWAAGFWGETTGDFHSLVMRWNGTSWQNIALPASITSPQSEVLSIKALSANDVWIVGYYLAGGGYKAHWDGFSWTESPDPHGGGGAFAAIASDDVYSVGSEIWHWDGAAWTPDETLEQITFPALINAVTFSNNEIWACGISMDADSNFHTLVYRSGGLLSSGANQKTEHSCVTIFPNPASDRLTVALNGFDATTFVISDAVGKVLTRIFSSETNRVEFDLSKYANGTYFLHIQGAVSTEVKKFIISK